jgi:GNAT superfamily N-acetyltransferase
MLHIRPARPGDAEVIAGLIRDLAAYENLAHEAEATPAQLDAVLFGASPRVFCDLADWDGLTVGLALWFYNFSTFRGRHGIWLEDLYVRPEQRGRGIGKALITALAKRCTAEGLGRLEWSVLDWNVSAIGFYEGLGAEVMPDWRICRLTGAALEAAGGGAEG